jgi:transcriptional antiterminator RfaH
METAEEAAGKDNEVMRWYVVHTQPQAEAKAVWHLENQGFRCFLPRVRAMQRHSRGVIQVLRPLFPRYLFVYFDFEALRWRAINGTRGVVRLLANGGDPLPVAPGVVEAVIQKCSPSGIVSLAAMGLFVEGASVRIKSGPFSDQLAKINEIYAEEDERVRVLLTLLGAETELLLPCYAIEAA